MLPPNRRSLLAALCAILALAMHASALRAETRISLAGTFNGWSTSDQSYTLEQDGQLLALRRFWSCGKYEFKFVFNGSWDRHLGRDSDGKLSQPGRDITLRIRQSGEYRLWLDVAKKRWGIKPTERSKHHPIIRVSPSAHNIYDIICDADGANDIEWDIQSPARRELWKLVRTESPGKVTLSTKEKATFDISVSVKSEAHNGQARISAVLGGAYDIQIANGVPQVMFPLDENRWIDRNPRQASANDLDARNPDPVTVTIQGQGVVKQATVPDRPWIMFDAASGEITSHESGFHLFLCRPERETAGLRIERVEVIGDFSAWQPAAQLTRLDGSAYGTVLELPDGIHHYQFLVNGCITAAGATNPRFRERDQYGAVRNGVLIGPDASQLGPPKPNAIVQKALKHDPTRSRYLAPWSDEVCRLGVRTLANDVERVTLLLGFGQSSERIPMKRTETQNGFDSWSAQVRARKPTLTYHFELQDGSQRLVLDADGVREAGSQQPRRFKRKLDMSFVTPDWPKRAVWYQIFPERFRNGNPDNDPPRTVPWSHEWYKPYKPEAKVTKHSSLDFTEDGNFYSYIYDRRYGGDLQGVREKLPYLRDLGVTAIYFNPIFQAESLHKYDASDYRHIDDTFAVRDSLKQIKPETADPDTWQWTDSDKLFLDFLDEAHRLGFKVILDGVFNHVGRDFWAFKDVLANGARSQYAGWFDITSFEPFHYKAWDQDDGALPRLKHDDDLGLAHPVREHLFAVTRRWMDPNGDGDPSDGIDGWRLDVAADINANFWKDWRTLVKSINPDAFIIAELWHESREWLDGKTFDAVMNYPFAERCQRFFVNQKKAVKAAKFEEELREMMAWYDPQVNLVLQNLFDSHDTDRAASMFMNPDLEYDKANRLQDNGPKYNPAKPTAACYGKLNLMVTFQMTFLGAPMIYYGNEVGMYGADDPSDRKPMLWPDLLPYDDPDERIEPAVLEHHRRLIAIRNTFPALQLGSFEVIKADSRLNLFAFSRTLNDECIVVVLNNSDTQRRLNVPVSWPDGSKVVRLDDPAACEIVQDKNNATARPRVQARPGHRAKVKVEQGHLHGTMLPPRTGAVFHRVR